MALLYREMLKLQAKGVAIWADEHHRNEAHYTYIYVYHQCIWGWQHLQKSSSKVISPIFFLLFLWHDSADCWSAHRSPAAHDSFKNMQDWCKAGWCRPGPPQTKIPLVISLVVCRIIYSVVCHIILSLVCHIISTLCCHITTSSLL